MRTDPARLAFEITGRDGAARTGRLLTGHGSVETPAFIPLATRGAVRTLSASDVAELGFELILGNTFHLFLSPGAERVSELGGLHRFMAWERAIITDSGGFQVFSLAHGNVADEIKGRRGGSGSKKAPQRRRGSANASQNAPQRRRASANASQKAPQRRRASANASQGGVLDISERGVAFRSYLDGSERFMGPEESMAVQAALGSDIALVFDECTPYHADREYTARSTARTHRWLDRCLEWHDAHGPGSQAVFGIVQGGVHEDLRGESAQRVGEAAVDGLAIGGTLGRDKAEMHGVLEMIAPMLPVAAPKHLLGIGEPDDLLAGIALGIDVFDCAVPTRLARHGMALAPLPDARFRFDLARAVYATDEGPLVEGCPCPTCAVHTRAYVHYLSRAEPANAGRLLTLHNLTFLERLVRAARGAIGAGDYAGYRKRVLGGLAPWEALRV